MDKLVEEIIKLTEDLHTDLVKTHNKSAQRRARKVSLTLEKKYKEFRKLSIK